MTSGRPGAKRIVFLDSFPRMGGAEQNLVDLLARLDRGRFAPVFVASGEGEVSRAVRKLDIPVLYCPLPEPISVVSRSSLGFGSLVGVPGHLVSYLRRLAATIRSVRPRLVYSNSLKDHLCAAFLARSLRKPVLWHLMDFLERRPLREFVEAVALLTPTRVFANSVATLRQFTRLSRRPHKARVIYEGLDLAEVDRRRAVGTRGFVPAHDAPVIAQVGAVCPEKGQEILLRSLPLLREHIPGLSCWIVGDEIYSTARHPRGYRGYLDDLARDLGVTDAVHFLGWRDDVIALIDRADIMVSVPNPELFTETFGRTPVEAMACEKPVVALARGGPCETMLDGVTGVLLRTYTPAALAEAILRLAGDVELRRRMGQAGRRRVAEHFTVEGYVRGVEAFIGEILGS